MFKVVIDYIYRAIVLDSKKMLSSFFKDFQQASFFTWNGDSLIRNLIILNCAKSIFPNRMLTRMTRLISNY